MRKLILAGLAVLLLVPVADSLPQHRRPSQDSQSDLGAGNKRWRDLYLSRDATVGRNATITGTLDVTGVITGTVTGTASDWNTTSALGGIMQPFVSEELIDLGGEDELAAVASSGNLLPANSLIFGVTIRCTEAFTGDAANFDVGDDSTATRFATNSTKISLNDTDVFLEAAVAQATASVIELLLDDAATAGMVRVTVFGVTLSAATS